jgi:hypothetical protein
MSLALLSGGHVTIPGTTSGTTSAGIDTTGASLLIVAVARHGFTSDPTLTDSYGNTWLPLTPYAGFIGYVLVYYAKNPTVGTGHTFTLAGGNTFPSACVAAFTGADTSAPFDVENGNGVSYPSSTTIQTGTLTPSQDDSLIIAALASAPNGGPSGYTIDSSFTLIDTVDAINGQSSGSGLAYFLQTTAAAKNPTWTLSTAGDGFGLAAAINSWKPAAGGGGGGGTPAPVLVPQIITFG